MTYFFLLSLSILLSGHTVYSQTYTEVPELKDKCVECILSSPYNYYCPTTGKCDQSDINDLSNYTCHTDS